MEIPEKTQRLTPVILRKRLGLTQEQTARAIGVRPATLSNWEAGHAPRVTPSLIKKMMEVYNCSLDDLIEAFERGDLARSSSEVK